MNLCTIVPVYTHRTGASIRNICRVDELIKQAGVELRYILRYVNNRSMQ